MKKMLFLAATAALALSSCSSDEIVEQATQKPVDDGAVMFSAYTPRITRAAADAENISEVAGLANAGGFGVFAYEQNKADFSTFSASTSYPNFFYNQQVWGSTLSSTTGHKAVSGTTEYNQNDPVTWEYAPIKYYSNNPSAKHSFFAYGPYSETISPVFALGKAPSIRYNIETDTDLDLLWATPVKDMEKPGISEKVVFNFQHALSQVSFQAVPFIDQVHNDAAHTAMGTLATGTTVTVKSIKFVGNVPSQALLSLDGAAPSWTIENTTESAYQFDVNTMEWVGANAACSYLPTTPNTQLVIPSDNVFIEVVYDVKTEDTSNSQNNSTVTNKIRSDKSFKLEPNKSYTFKLDLGLTSVKFDATVTDWQTGDTHNVDLPNNSYITNITRSVVTTATAIATVTTGVPSAEGIYAISSNKLYIATGTSAASDWKEVIAAERPAYLYDGTTFYVLDPTAGTYASESLDTSTYTNYDAFVEAIDNGTAPTAAAYYKIGSSIYKVAP